MSVCSQCPRAGAEPPLCDRKCALEWDNDAGTNSCLFMSLLGLWSRALVSCLNHTRPCTAPEGTEPFPNQTGCGFLQDLLPILPAAGKTSVPRGVSPTPGTPAVMTPPRSLFMVTSGRTRRLFHPHLSSSWDVLPSHITGDARRRFWSVTSEFSTQDWEAAVETGKRRHRWAHGEREWAARRRLPSAGAFHSLGHDKNERKKECSTPW